MEGKQTLLTALLVLLVITVGLQTVQLASSLGGGTGTVAVRPATTTTAGSPATGSSLQNLPSMVGGC